MTLEDELDKLRKENAFLKSLLPEEYSQEFTPTEDGWIPVNSYSYDCSFQDRPLDIDIVTFTQYMRVEPLKIFKIKSETKTVKRVL